ncbi:hypothetical protein ACRAWD_04470 [Caulobacter segnis]
MAGHRADAQPRPAKAESVATAAPVSPSSAGSVHPWPAVHREQQPAADAGSGRGHAAQSR